MSYVLIRSATTQSNSYPIISPVWKNLILDVLYLRHFKITEPGNEPTIPWSVISHAEHSVNEEVLTDYINSIYHGFAGCQSS